MGAHVALAEAPGRECARTGARNDGAEGPPKVSAVEESNQVVSKGAEAERNGALLGEDISDQFLLGFVEKWEGSFVAGAREYRQLLSSVEDL